MAPDTTSSKVRRGAKSCAECRRRKIRCTWTPSNQNSGVEERTACNRCVARGLDCLPQLLQPNPRAAKGLAAIATQNRTPRDRIGHLEQQVASLTALLSGRSNTSGLEFSPTPDRDVYDSEHHTAVSSTEHEAISDDLDHRSDIGGIQNPPSHLRVLFDHFDLHQVDDAVGKDREKEKAQSVMHANHHNMEPWTDLQALLPSREEIQSIAGFASNWMALYHSLFPAYFTFRSGHHLVDSHDRMRDSQVHPIVLSTYLMSVAITTQQLRPEEVSPKFWQGYGAKRFVDAVCRVVSRTVIQNDALSKTAQWVESAMLFIRLLLGRGNLRTTWVLLRRVIAIAEVIGLPLAHYQAQARLRGGVRNSADGSELETLKIKAAVWESVCATDRNFGMMLNLPAGTSRYTFPFDTSILRDGRVSAQAYNYQLSAISGLVFEVDESYMRGISDDESYEKVLTADRRLRALAASAPREWWQRDEKSPLADLMVKFWHNYIIARVHLRPAMMNDSLGQYTYSNVTCLDACRHAIRRFLKFRLLTPSGFFVCRILDVQAFTVASFLLLSCRSNELNQTSPIRPTNDITIDPYVTELVHELVDCLTQVSEQPGSDFAREAIGALTTLESFMFGKVTAPSNSLTLKIPMLGSVSIRVPEGYCSNHQAAAFSATVAPNPSHASLQTHFPEGYNLESNAQSSAALLGNPAIDAPLNMSWDFEFANTPFWMMPDSIPGNNFLASSQPGESDYSIISWT